MDCFEPPTGVEDLKFPLASFNTLSGILAGLARGLNTVLVEDNPVTTEASPFLGTGAYLVTAAYAVCSLASCVNKFWENRGNAEIERRDKKWREELNCMISPILRFKQRLEDHEKIHTEIKVGDILDDKITLGLVLSMPRRISMVLKHLELFMDIRNDECERISERSDEKWRESIFWVVISVSSIVVASFTPWTVPAFCVGMWWEIGERGGGGHRRHGGIMKRRLQLNRETPLNQEIKDNGEGGGGEGSAKQKT
jgi:hypothetical protein